MSDWLHTISRIFHLSLPEAPDGTINWVVPVDAAGVSGIRTETSRLMHLAIREALGPSNCNLWRGELTPIVPIFLSLGVISPKATPQHPLPVCDASASGLTKRINLQSWVSSHDQVGRQSHVMYLTVQASSSAIS